MRAVRYLGIHVEERLKTEAHVEDVSAKALAGMASFKRCMREEGGISYVTMVKIYRCVVEPILMYGAEFRGA